VTKAERALDLAETGYQEIREVELTVAVKKEMVQEAQVALATARHQLAFTQVRAPFPGIVVKRYRSLGDTVSAGVPLLSMYNPELIYVTANLEEDRLRGVAPGNAVTLDIDAFDRPFKGRVVWLNKSTGAQFALMPRNVVAGEFTKVVQRVPVRIWIEKDERWPQLRAGLSARVVIEHGSGDAAWAARAARDMAQVELQYNRPERDDVQAAGDRAP
jgi:membrane fusion protein (multidrug efflux system)